MRCPQNSENASESPKMTAVTSFQDLRAGSQVGGWLLWVAGPKAVCVWLRGSVSWGLLVGVWDLYEALELDNCPSV